MCSNLIITIIRNILDITGGTPVPDIFSKWSAVSISIVKVLNVLTKDKKSWMFQQRYKNCQDMEEPGKILRRSTHMKTTINALLKLN